MDKAATIKTDKQKKQVIKKLVATVPGVTIASDKKKMGTIETVLIDLDNRNANDGKY
jgi:hypothetical protein